MLAAASKIGEASHDLMTTVGDADVDHSIEVSHSHDTSHFHIFSSLVVCL